MVQTNVSQNCELPTTDPPEKTEKEPSFRANKDCFDIFFKGNDGRHSLKQLTLLVFLSLVFVPRWQYLEKVMFHCWKYRGARERA